MVLASTLVVEVCVDFSRTRCVMQGREMARPIHISIICEGNLDTQSFILGVPEFH
jgi:hypothetical protein